MLSTYQYAAVHLYYTIPIAIVLHFILAPLRTKRDLFNIFFIAGVALVYTTPWDSYLVRNKIWTYPEGSVISTFLSIPIEEVFFFLIQTYITSSLFIMLSKRVLHPLHLEETPPSKRKTDIGMYLASFVFIVGGGMLYFGEKTTYLGLILVWTSPIIGFIIFVSGSYTFSLPASVTLTSIILPTLYLWIVDSLALRNGAWTIELATKLNWRLFGVLDIEEAVFFLVTNCMVVLGIATCEKAFAVIDTFHLDLSSMSWRFCSPQVLTEAISFHPSSDQLLELNKLKSATRILKVGSKSFYFASAVFGNRCRITLLHIYAFSRVADDLIDKAETLEEGNRALRRIKEFLQKAYHPRKESSASQNIQKVGRSRETDIDDLVCFPSLGRAPLFIPRTIFSELVEGFESDLHYLKLARVRAECAASERGDVDAALGHLPIQTQEDLILYCRQVAGTVGQMLVYATWDASGVLPRETKEEAITSMGSEKWLLDRASDMGVALQLVNIARDIMEDSRNGRVYLPVEWFATTKENAFLKFLLCQPSSINTSVASPPIDSFYVPLLCQYALRLLTISDRYYSRAKEALEYLPSEFRMGARLAVHVYMEIGKEIRRREGNVSQRAILGLGGKLRVARKILYGF